MQNPGGRPAQRVRRAIWAGLAKLARLRLRQGNVTSTKPPSPPAWIAPPVVVPAELVPERHGAVAILSSVNRDGDWILPRVFRVVAFMGNVELDLTSVRIGPGESHIEIRCMWGNVEIKVPPDIRVEVEGHPFVGFFEVSRKAPTTHSRDAPVLRITGSAVMGAVTIYVVDPNAPGWLERLKRSVGSGRSA
jgi:cell wall-active antibiotic response 4TMS protein YvqF